MRERLRCPLISQSETHVISSWACRPKDALDIVIQHLRILEQDEHIGMMSACRIDEAQRHWDQIRSWSIDPESNIHFGMSGITTWQFNNFNLSTHIECDEMAGYAARFMPHKCVHLEGAWPSIV